jgi:tyrosine aminotransferase
VDEVVLYFGGTNALSSAISVLCERGTNLLVPTPGFPLSRPVCSNLGVEIKFYNLLPDKNWEVDIENLKSQIDDRTKAILITNPSNPCGTVFSREH